MVEHSHDFVVIDTPATDFYLRRRPHAMADTLVTPLNDSFSTIASWISTCWVRRRDDLHGHRPLCRNGSRGASVGRSMGV